MRLIWGEVVEVSKSSPDVQRLVVLAGGEAGKAVAYPRLTGACKAGDQVLLNTTAVDLALGTGGSHVVVARSQADTGQVAQDTPSGGHIMKMRYSPLQLDVIAVEEQGSEHHEVMEAATSLEGMPVVCCGLHSQLPLAAAAAKAAGAEKVAYVMTDQAALPMPLSSLARKCRAKGLVDVTVSCGQAFGGELEAVTLHSGLLAARHVAAADVAVVAIGPGVTGTGTPFGHGGVAQGEAVNAVASLGGRPVAALRLSFADTRERHRVVSHHSLVALSTVALARAWVAVPSLPAEQARQVARSLEEGGVASKHELASSAADAVPACRELGVPLKTMGRSPEDDPAFFAAASAAGDVAARLLKGRPLAG